MKYTITKSIDNPRLWLVKNEDNRIVKYAYSKEEAQNWIDERI